MDQIPCRVQRRRDRPGSSGSTGSRARAQPALRTGRAWWASLQPNPPGSASRVLNLSLGGRSALKDCFMFTEVIWCCIKVPVTVIFGTFVSFIFFRYRLEEPSANSATNKTTFAPWTTNSPRVEWKTRWQHTTFWASTTRRRRHFRFCTNTCGPWSHWSVNRRWTCCIAKRPYESATGSWATFTSEIKDNQATPNISVKCLDNWSRSCFVYATYLHSNQFPLYDDRDCCFIYYCQFV